jgi:hypothetical protein
MLAPSMTGALAAAASLLAAAGPRAPLFVEAARESGLDFVHFNGMSGELYFPETMGGGAALFDYDGDGDLDCYLVQGAMLGPGKTLAQAVFPPRRPPRGQLFRNDLGLGADGRPRARFVDVTDASGIEARGYGMGVAAGDVDNDGDVDLYTTNFGANQLWRNRGDGSFGDATAASGAGHSSWSVSAAFVDYDRDGWLDLMVANYVDYSLERNPACYAPSSRRDYCGPGDFPPLPATLLRNRGDGTFADVSARSGVAARPGPGLGVLAFDADGDSWPDLYVANDGADNYLWLNRRDGSFREAGLLAGVAVNRLGRPEASMGVDAGDFDADGDEDLFLTHLTGETNTLYLNLGGGFFEDRTAETRAGQGTLPFTGFGTGWVDVDNDGWLDLPVFNGGVRLQEEGLRRGERYPLAQTSQLYRNGGDGRFVEATAEAGPVFEQAAVSRGAAFGDVDVDGDVDAVVVNSNGAAWLLLGQAADAAGNAWLEARVAAGGRDAHGARVAVEAPGRPTLWRRVHSDGSYASASDPRVHFGLGPSGPGVLALTVQWPGGGRSVWRGVAARRVLVLAAGAERLKGGRD